MRLGACFAFYPLTCVLMEMLQAAVMSTCRTNDRVNEMILVRENLLSFFP